MSSQETLRRIQERLSDGAVTAQVIEGLLPRTRTDAITWARRLTGWDEYRGQFSDQVIGVARVISRRAMRTFGLTFGEDGRVLEGRRGGPWQTPRPSLTFRLAIRGEEVRVEYTPGYFPDGCKDHFAFISPHEPPQPHGLSESGYLSQLAPHEAVEACGGPEAYAGLFAEARLAGQERAFVATFAGEWPEPGRTRRRQARRPPSPPATGEATQPVAGEHVARVIEEQQAQRPRDEPPRQRFLF